MSGIGGRMSGEVYILVASGLSAGEFGTQAYSMYGFADRMCTRHSDVLDICRGTPIKEASQNREDCTRTRIASIGRCEVKGIWAV